MAYEIPQQLQYEEKIIFGLTFKQLFYGVIFLLPSLYIFMKTGFGLYIKLFLGTLLIGIACLFMFFGFEAYIRNMLSWLKFRKASHMDPKMIKFLGIKKIENGVIHVICPKKYN